jgi:hypothetical protein
MENWRQESATVLFGPEEGGGGGGGGFLTFKGLLSPFKPIPLLLGAKLASLAIILPLLLLTALHV